jgi:glycosyl hydrolase family 99
MDDRAAAAKSSPSSAGRGWRRPARFRVIALVAATAAALSVLVGIVWAPRGIHQPPGANLPSLTFPIRAAFYYPWFPEAWRQQGMDPFARYEPSLGYYSTSQATVSNQIRAMQYANIGAGIASWWGQGSQTDSRIPTLLQAASTSDFAWALYYEPEGQGDPPSSQIAADLRYIREHYARTTSYLRVGGHPVLFAYADAGDSCGMAARWKEANTLGFYVVLKVFPGYQSCSAQPDGWHQYAPANAEDSQPGFSFAISPGFWKASEPSARLARNPAAWSTSVADMVASKAPWQLIATFNEWGEGSAVEDAVEWQTASGFGTYLDVLHQSR